MITNIAFLLTLLGIVIAPLYITKEAYADVDGLGDFIGTTIGVVIGWILVFLGFKFVFLLIIG